MKMKIILVSFIILLFIIICIYVEVGSEGFVDGKYDKNQINDKIISNINNLSTIDKNSYYKELSAETIKTKLENELELNTDLLYNLKKGQQNNTLTSLQNNINRLKNNKELSPNMKQKNNSYLSIKSHENSQPISLFPLSNNKYLISLNGKCLDSDIFNKNSINPCNSQNPNQYFNIDLINNNDDYKQHTFGQIHNTSNVKYPFHIVKSESGNCVGNSNGSLSIGPCVNNKKQRWEASTNPILCTVNN